MITNIACGVILFFCFAYSFFMGAYNYVLKEMVVEKLISYSLVEIANINIQAALI